MKITEVKPESQFVPFNLFIETKEEAILLAAFAGKLSHRTEEAILLVDNEGHETITGEVYEHVNSMLPTEVYAACQRLIVGVK